MLQAICVILSLYEMPADFRQNIKKKLVLT